MARKGSGKGARAGYAKKQIASTREILSPFYDLPKDRAGLEAVYRTLAKSADQRLVRLEKYVKEEGYGSALQWAYRRAERDIRAWGGEKATRWNIKAPDSIAGLKAKIEDIKTFLEAESSTKKGIAAINERRVNTINEKYGTNFSPNELKNFMGSNLWKEMSDESSYGSKNAFRIIGTVQKNKKKLIDGVKRANEIDLQVPDEMVETLTQNAIAEHGKELVKFLKGQKLRKAKA